MQIDYAILCDQVRREDNGKLLIIGAYVADIRFPSLPAMAQVSLLVWFNSAEAGQVKMEMKAEFKSKIIVSGAIDLGLVPASKGLAVFADIPLQISEAGLLEFSVRAGRDWKVVWSGEAGVLNNENV